MLTSLKRWASLRGKKLKLRGKKLLNYYGICQSKKNKNSKIHIYIPIQFNKNPTSRLGILFPFGSLNRQHNFPNEKKLSVAQTIICLYDLY